MCSKNAQKNRENWGGVFFFKRGGGNIKGGGGNFKERGNNPFRTMMREKIIRENTRIGGGK